MVNLVMKQALRGTGAGSDTDGGTWNAGLAANTGILTSNQAADLTEATAVTRLANYQGTIAASDIVAGDLLYYVFDNGTDSYVLVPRYK